MKEEHCAVIELFVEYTVTDSPFSTQENFSKCPPSAWIHFLTRVTRELTKHCSLVDASCSAENSLE
jgi:hypothetical protein